MNDKSLTMPQKIVSIVVPVYCNEGSLERTYDEVVSQFKEIDYDYEFVFVNDGSTDNSQKILNYLKERDKKVRVMRFTRNFGQMAALLAGLDRAKGDCAITISADLQDPASLIPQMIHHWASGSELVVCSREAREDPYAAKWQSALAYWLLRQAHPQMPKGGFDFVLIGRKALDTFNSIDNRNRYFQGDLLWMGHTISVIPYKRKKREHGKSGYTFWKKMKNFIDAILVASYMPIRFISLVGIIVSFSGFLYAITVLLAWFFGYVPFSGWAPIIIINLVVGGLTIVMLGIIGEYIWRIYDELRKRPNYLVLEDTDET